jgi:hypothetical protein
VDEALGLLASYSMITLTAHTVSMHRLVQAVILETPADPRTELLRDIALAWLNRAFPLQPQNDVAAWPLEVRALAVTEAALGPDHPSTARRRDNLAALYRAAGREADAAAMERRAR